MRKLFSIQILMVLFTFLVGVGCSEDNKVELPDLSSGISFSYELEDMGVMTRTVLTDSAIEDKITGITLFVYSDDNLVASKHFTSGLTSMTLDLVKGRSYDIIALANMGDMSSSLPDSFPASSRGDFKWSVPSYSVINSRGIPMAGQIIGYKTGDSTTITLKRLFAKVTANISVTYKGASLSGITVRNLNGKISPFGSSAASRSSDILSEWESAVAAGPNGTYVFYVPENMQGVIGSATDSHEKNPDIDAAIAAASSRLTYIESKVTMSGDGHYGGEVTYRSYLGNNSTRNFDIKGNCRYIWNIAYLENNLQYDDWKIDTGEMTDERVLNFTQDPVFVEAGQQVNYSDVIETSLEWNEINHKFQQEVSGTLSSTSQVSLQVSEAAKDGATVSWDIKPIVNPASIGDQATIRVVKRYIEIAEESYSVDPGSSVEAEVLYGDSGRGRLIGRGGSEWSHEVSDGLSASYSSADDQIVLSVPKTTVPGDYSLSVKTVDSKFSDEANVRVNDTRYIRLLSGGSPAGTASSSGSSLSAPANVGYFKGSEQWTFNYTFGDVTGTGNMYGNKVDEASDALNIEFDDTWLELVSLDLSSVAVRPKAGIPSGSYPVTLKYSSDGASPVVAYLNVSGKLVEQIVINVAGGVVYVGESLQLSAAVTPADATVRDLQWEIVSGQTNASINAATGLLTGVKSGTAQVRAVAKDGSGVVSAPASIEVRQHVTSVKLDKNTASVRLGETLALNATVLPSDAYDKSLTWSSSNGSIATVSQNGIVTPKAKGTCIIRATSNDVTSIYDECTVSVGEAAVSSVDIGSGIIKLIKSETAQTYTISGKADLADGTSVTNGIKWSSSNASVATVSSAGVVTAVNYGSATITASYTSGGVTKTATRTVQVSLLTLSPEGPISLNVGETKALAVSLKNHNGSTSVVTGSSTWTSSASSVVSVNGGSVKALKQGSAKITANYSGTEGTGSVSVTANVSDVITYDLIIDPSSATINYNETKQLTAKYRTYTNGTLTNTQTVTANWSMQSGSTYASVTSAGVVKGLKGGSAVVKASYNGYVATANITVKDVITYSLEVTPASASVNVGATTQLTAKYYTTTNDVKNAGVDVTSSATWSTSSGTVATVSGGKVSGKSKGSAKITATYSGVSASSNITVNDVITYSLEVTPATATVNAKSTVSFTATYYTLTNGVKDAGTNVTSSASWSSSSTSIATVSKGTVTGVKGGTATITATYSGKSGSATVTVKDVITYDLIIDPSSATINYNETKQLAAKYRTYTNGTLTNTQTVTASWSMQSGGACASVDASGVVKGLSGGSAVVKATYNGYTATANITVKDVTTYDLVIDPASASINYNEAKQFTAIYRSFKNGTQTSTQAVSATWSMQSGGTYASVNSTGLVTGLKGGSAVVKATYNGYTATANVTVKSVTVYELALDKTSATVLVGSSTSFKATYYTITDGVRNSGSDVTRSAVWNVASGSSAITLSSGTVTGVAVGNARITATYNSLSVTADVQVKEPSVTSVTISPTAVKYIMKSAIKETAQYTATVVTENGHLVRNVIWTTDNPGIASVNQSGLVTAEGYGQTTVTASYTSGGVTKSASATVRVSEMLISPAETTAGVGESVQYELTVYKYDGTSKDAKYSAEWSSSNNTIASSQNYGKFKLNAAGKTQIRADYSNSLEGTGYMTASVTGVTVPSSISLSSQYEYLLKADEKQTYQATATVSKSDGTTTSSGIVWSSENSKVASVNQNGLITAEGYGQTMITATYTLNGKSVSAQIEVLVSELSITPKNLTLDQGSSYKLSAQLLRYNGTTSNAYGTWTSSNTSAVTVSSGTVNGVAGGTSKVRLTYSSTYGNGYAECNVSVIAPEITYSLEVTPSTNTVDVGSTVNYIAKYYTLTNGVKDSGIDVTSSATWSSSNSSIASVSKGAARGVSEGSATLTARYNGYTATATVQVRNVITYDLIIDPSSATINYKETRQLAAKYRTFTNGTLTSTQAVTATWSMQSGSTYASVNSTGLVTGLKGGSAVVKATYSNYAATANITVKDVYSYDLIIEPSEVTINYGHSAQMTAKYRTYINDVLSNTQIVNASWSMQSGSSYASVNAAGVVTGLNGGTAYVKATYNSYNATAKINVINVVTYKERLEIIGGSTLYVGATATYSLRKYTDTYTNGVKTTTDYTGQIIANGLATWSIASGNSYAVIDASGTVTGVAAGNVIVKATLKSDSSVYATKSLVIQAKSGVGLGTGWDDDGNIEL